LDGSHQTHEIEFEIDSAVRISAVEGDGIPQLMAMLEKELFEAMEQIKIFLPYDAMALQSLLHEQGSVDYSEHKQDGVVIRGRVPKHLAAQFRKYRI
jgi:GTP-binding protein HflX